MDFFDVFKFSDMAESNRHVLVDETLQQSLFVVEVA